LPYCFVFCAKGLTVVLQSCKVLHSSLKLKRLIELVLILGNYLNSNSFRGNCAAFKISSTLNELPNMKGTDGKSLLHYLIRTIQPKEPELCNLPSDFEILNQAVGGAGQFVCDRMFGGL